MELSSRLGQLRGITKLRKFARKNLTTEDINKLLLAPDKKGSNGCHFAAESGGRETFKKLWECAKCNVTTGEIKNVITTENEGMTVWQYAAKWENLKALQKSLNYAK